MLRRLRAVLGPDLPIAVSLDLHASISADFVELASVITVFRTYPHLDMADTGARAIDALLHMLDGGRLCPAFRQSPFLIPTHAQCTDLAPCRDLYDLVEERSAKPGAFVDMALGFTAADIPDCGPAILAYADTPEAAAALADEVPGLLLSREPDFDTRLLTPDEALLEAKALHARHPVVLADVQGTPGTGGTSETTDLLRTVIAARPPGVAMGIFWDPALAQAAHAAGEAAVVQSHVGGRFGDWFSPPEASSRDDVTADGPNPAPATGPLLANSKCSS